MSQLESDGGLHYLPTPAVQEKDVLEEIRITDSWGGGEEAAVSG